MILQFSTTTSRTMVASLPRVRHAAAALVHAVAHADVLHRRTIRVFHRVGSLGALARDAIVRDGEEAAVDRDVAGTVDVDSVGAGGLLVVVRNLETHLAHEYAVAVVEMEIPELRILERDALDLHSARTLDERHASAGNAEVRESSLGWAPRCAASRTGPRWGGPPRRAFPRR